MQRVRVPHAEPLTMLLTDVRCPYAAATLATTHRSIDDPLVTNKAFDQ